MKIMLFSRILAKTGVGSHVDQLADSLQKLGHKVIVVSGTKDIELSNPNVEFFRVNTLSNNPFRVLQTVFKLRKLIKEQAIDIVHCHHRKAAIFMQLCRAICRVPFVYTLHLADVPSDFFHRKMTFVGKKAIGVSTEVREFLVNRLRIPESKTVTVLNGVDPEKLLPLTEDEKKEIKSAWSIPEDALVFAMHSRIAPVKNHMLVVEALSVLSEEERGRLVVVCSGEKKGEYYEALLDAIEKRGLLESFRFVGWTSARQLLGISDFLLLPSLNEGFALNVSEAFFMRVPVARTETAGFRDQEYCLPISMTDPTDVVDIMKRAIEKGFGEYSDRVEKAYALAVAKLSCTKMAENTAAVYEEVLGLGK